jgi:hypothetical protein
MSYAAVSLHELMELSGHDHSHTTGFASSRGLVYFCRIQPNERNCQGWNTVNTSTLLPGIHLAGYHWLWLPVSNKNFATTIAYSSLIL